MLGRHPKVKDAVVLEQEESQMGQRLVAYAVPDLQHSATVKGHQRYQLPNGMAIVHYLKNETDYLYRDIFDDWVYMRHGIMLCEGDCVFDVGANIGLFTLFVQQYCPNTKVYAFEPIPPLFERLSINANLYGTNGSVFEYGLSNESSEVPFTFYPKSSLLSGRYADAQSERQLVKSYMQNQQQRDSTQTAKEKAQFMDELLDGHFERETFVCPLRRLSQVIQEHGIERIDLLKIDVERSELDVIEGIDDKDWEKIRQLVIEVEDSEGRLTNIISRLEVHGYKVAIEQEPLLSETNLYNIYATQRAAHRDPSLGRTRVGFTAALTALSCSILTADELRDFVKFRLPEYMVPAAFVFLEALPLTPNGKVDRKRLPDPDIEAQLAHQYVGLRNPTEEILANIWAEVLRVERVGVHDNFFELGGHSLLATQIASRIRTAFAIDLSLRTVFEITTVAGLSEAVDLARLTSKRLASTQVTQHYEDIEL